MSRLVWSMRALTWSLVSCLAWSKELFRSAARFCRVSTWSETLTSLLLDPGERVIVRGYSSAHGGCRWLIPGTNGAIAANVSGGCAAPVTASRAGQNRYHVPVARQGVPPVQQLAERHRRIDVVQLAQLGYR